MRLACSAALLLVIPAFAAETRLGKPLTVEKPIAIRELLEHADAHLGRAVRVEGEMAAVCQMMGCWMEVRDGSGASIRLKVEDGEIVFPQDGVGRKVAAQGTLEKIVLTPEQHAAALEHEARETGKPIDRSRPVEGKTVYRLRGHGAVLR